MEFVVGKRYDISAVIAGESIYVGTPKIITCHFVDKDGDLWSTDIVYRGVSGSSKIAEADIFPAGWCISDCDKRNLIKEVDDENN